MRKPKGFQGSMGLILIGMVLILSAQPAMSATTSGIHINEVLFNPGDGAYQWVELKNSGTTAVHIGGYRITNEAGAWYTIPAALPAVPSGAFVVVVFDGAGSGGDDYDFSDKVATLHSGPELVNILGRTAGQCALYDSSPFKLYLPGILSNFQGTKLSTFSPPSAFLPPVMPSYDAWSDPSNDRASGASKARLWSKRMLKSLARELGAGLSSSGPAILSFVAWGAEPGNRTTNASKVGLWSPRWFVNLVRGLGIGDPSTAPNETIGILPGSLKGYPDDWALYQAGEVTKGGENPVPGISFYYPLSGATMEDIAFSISWSPVRDATGYQFQMATNSTFTSLVVNKTLPEAVFIPTTTVAQGTYYWRVKVLLAGRESPWSNVFQIKSETLPVSLAGAEGLLGAPPSQKRYVTPRIAWKLQHKDTSLLCLDGCQLTGPEAWNRPHTVRGTHGRNYCARASMSMLLSYYGGKISQDRLSYQMWSGAQAEGELGHDKTPPTWHSITDVLNWALGVDVGLEPPLVSLQWGKPTFAEIKSWVDANRPSITVFGNPDNSSHARVMDGYFEIGTHQKIHLLDPWTRDTGAGQDKGWVNYADDNIIAYWVGPSGPGGAPNVKSDEATMTSDFDHDDILDFDEINRFHTDPTGDDSDLDLVKDKQEIQEYTFNAAGLYAHRNPDWDGTDGRKELDPDNDGGGLIDGCEDINHTDSFKPEDDKVSSTTLIYPSGTINSSLPTYKWNAVCGGKSYWLLVDDTTGRGKIFKQFTASEAGCASGTGTCSVTPSISIADGNATWWIDPCHSRGCGDWSNALGFVVGNTEDSDIVGLWKFPDTSSVRAEAKAGVGYEYVGKMVTLSEKQARLNFKVGEEVWWLKKDKPGQYSGLVAWRDSSGGYWKAAWTVWVKGNEMLDSAGKVIGTR